MLAWRICKQSAIDDLSGQGAAAFGGRWNHPDHAALYLSLSAAGCALDRLILGAGTPCPGTCLVQLQLPDDPQLYRTPTLDELPPGWDALPADRASMDWGSDWLGRNDQLGLIVPSATITHTRNLLLNPRHAAVAQIRVMAISTFNCA
ncbi:RES family NAD+ phosphorylase [Pseudomonas sp. NFR16]|uniref:RES family NAD+ phosphorylase n=1 Tax=Pseudomonas sp. NFR16 TaxID=1566248 RepID=UPI0008AACA91|nr:RES family NAD+ phosphorylase [Pseudomonas sp. NFR16]SEI61771.1 RES domain-containing protein [Pseudomonas sp. NFR16]